METQKPQLLRGFGWNMPEPLRDKDPRDWELSVKTRAVGDGGVSSDLGPGIGVVIGMTHLHPVHV